MGASAITFTTEFTNVYFGGKLIYRNQHTGGSVYPSAIVTDRVGSVVSAGPYQNRSYYPYGEEKGTPTANGADKFATYYRDEHTEFDYAMQRYYHSGSGRFLTPAPTAPPAAPPTREAGTGTRTCRGIRSTRPTVLGWTWTAPGKTEC